MSIQANINSLANMALSLAHYKEQKETTKAVNAQSPQSQAEEELKGLEKGYEGLGTRIKQYADENKEIDANIEGWDDASASLYDANNELIKKFGSMRDEMANDIKAKNRAYVMKYPNTPYAQELINRTQTHAYNESMNARLETMMEQMNNAMAHRQAGYDNERLIRQSLESVGQNADALRAMGYRIGGEYN